MADIESLRRLIEENLEKKRENDSSIKAKAFKEATAALNIITNKKKSPNIDLITKLKKKYDKKEDFKNMCENPEVFNKTLISLGINEKELKKICENLQIFTENLQLSPKEIKEKMRATQLIDDSYHRGTRLDHLPEDVIRHITDKLLYPLLIEKFKKTDKYKLIDEIPEDKLNHEYLSENPKAIDYILKNKIPIDYFYLSRNKSDKAMEILKEHLKINPNDENIAWRFLCESEIPEAFEILQTYPSKIQLGHIRDNINPDVIQYLHEHDQIFYYKLSNKTSPFAIELLKEQIRTGPEILNWKDLSANPEAIELLKANEGRINWKGLSRNHNPEAIELLKENPGKIDYEELSLNTNSDAIELLKQKPEKINWRYLLQNTNPKGIEYIKELLKINPNDKDIHWTILSKNTAPGAIKLLKERNIVENKLSYDEYDALNYEYKINWEEISKNPKAIELIKERIKYEKNVLSEDRLKKLNSLFKLNWKELSKNPSIFTIIKDI
jgi:hypothetical protein